MPRFFALSAFLFFSFFSFSDFCFFMASGFCLSRGVALRSQPMVMSHFSLASTSFG